MSEIAADLPQVAAGVTTMKHATACARNNAVEWLALDDPAVSAEVDEQSARPITYANRLRPLRGTDPAFVRQGSGGDEPHVVTYDALVGAVEHIRAAASVTYESRTFHLGGSDSDAALLEVILAGVSGAAAMIAPADLDESAIGQLLADEWVTHFIAESDLLGSVDPSGLDELEAAVVIGEISDAATELWSGDRRVVVLDEPFASGSVARS